ncbi:hypothetical protein E2C06_20095 [Dankookia rubra]|uniref:Uncharacterized protein n=1 Tax=Dankookia rubra TaxID=1442381 RepID=A0A4R5QE85_9PROT|nr:hypothetical protein [Dankookia rubra]TDH60801.1 hypothetical protein E2C06_20095 [Dankookia rubra]
MTAQFAILNREAIVLAADRDPSANGKEAGTNSRSMFSLGPRNQMAIMVWGKDNFAGVPWTMLVDTFKAEAGRKSFKTVADCGTAFMQLLKDKRFRSDGAATTTDPKLILHNLEKLCSELPEGVATSDAEQIRRLACADFIADLRNHEQIPGAPSPAQFLSKINRGLLRNLAKAMLGAKITPTLLKQIEWISFEAATRKIASGSESGIIIAGYGHTEHFPSVQEYIIDGQCGNFTRSWLRDRHSIDGASARSQILDFSASGGLQTIISGIAPAYVSFIGEAYFELIDKTSNYALGANGSLAGGAVSGQKSECQTKSELLQETLDDLIRLRNKMFTIKLLDHIGNLSKVDLVDLALTLVESASLMTRIFFSTEWNGNLVDLAVISKEDGFVWAGQPIAHKSLECAFASESSRASTVAPNSAA